MSPLVQIDKSFRKQSEMEILATFLSNTRENNFQSNSNGKFLFLMIKSKTGFWLNDEGKKRIQRRFFNKMENNRTIKRSRDPS